MFQNHTLSFLPAIVIGVALILALLGGLNVHAQTTTSTGTDATINADAGTTGAADTATPGLPNTGAGGSVALNLAVLAVSGILIGFAVELFLKSYPR